MKTQWTLIAAAVLVTCMVTLGEARAAPEPALDRAVVERLVRAQEAQAAALKDQTRAIERLTRAIERSGR